MSFEQEWQARSAAIEEQARLVEQCADPATRAAALDLVRSVMELHKSALQRILAIVEEKAEDGGGIVEALSRDPLVRSVLVLHDLHPDNVETRVARVLEEMQPKLQRHNAAARLVSAADGTVRVFLEASSGCGSNIDGLKTSLEQALLDAAPDAEIVVESNEAANSGFVSLDALRPPSAETPTPAPAAIPDPAGVAQN